MDRQAISKRLEGLSNVFASHTPMYRDLKAMSYVLANMKEDQFTKILAAEYMADEPVESVLRDMPAGPAARGPKRPMVQIMSPLRGKQDVVNLEDLSPRLQDMVRSELTQKQKAVVPGAPAPVMASEEGTAAEEVSESVVESSDESAGLYWNRDASEAVMNNLIRDVTGMNKTICCDTGSKLTPEQTPDGKHAGVPEKPTTLKDEQTPDQVDVLDSGIVEESNKTPLKKEAGSKKGPGVPDGTGPGADSGKCPMKKDDEKKDDEVKDKDKKDDEEKDDEKKDDEVKDSSVIDFEGIELTASMGEVDISPEEADKLSKLF